MAIVRPKPAPLPPEVQKLINTYQKAQQRLIETIAIKEARGNVTWYQKSLLQQVEAEVQRLNSFAVDWAKTEIPKSYKKGVDTASNMLKQQGVSVLNAFSQLQTEVVELMVMNAASDLVDANLFVGRQIRDNVRQAGIEAVTEKLTTGQTVQQCKKNLIDKMVQQGIQGLQMKNGRMMNLASYAETVARSTTREATNRGTINQLTNLGYDLVKVSYHKSSCPVCAAYEGRVYSISGNDRRFPPLKVAYSGDHLNIHPNCRHVLMPWVEGMKSTEEIKQAIAHSNRPFDIDPRSKQQKDTYDKQQQQKRDLRTDRRDWEKYKFVLGKDAPSFADFRKWKAVDSQEWKDLHRKYLLKNAANGKIDYSEVFAHLPDAERKAVGETFKDADGKHAVVIAKYADKLKKINTTSGTSYYQPANVTVNLSKRYTIGGNEWKRVFAHEFGHLIDFVNAKEAAFRPGAGVLFGSSYRDLTTSVFKDSVAILKDPQTVIDLNKLLQSIKYQDRCGLSDIFCCATNTRVQGYYGHSMQYLKKAGNAETEVFANMFQLNVYQDKEALDIIEKHLPELFKAYYLLIEKMGAI